jgi:outer membrane protein OmpA-like peptidoglycan-associated protein
VSTLVKNLSKLAGISTLVVIAGCSSQNTKPEGMNDVRAKLTQLQSDSQLIQLAPIEFNDAERAVLSAEQPREDKALADHLMLVADRKVDIAEARAQSRLLVSQREALSREGDAAKLASRTSELESARRETASAKADAEELRLVASAEKDRNKEFEKQLDILNAKATDRGMVMTLSDLSFATGKAELKTSVLADLDNLADFLDKYPDRNIMIEGHTDNVGSDALNLKLSKRRATSVRDYLVTKGINSGRLTVVAKGENSPVDTNESALGRQHNRRVDVIISNTVTSKMKALSNDTTVTSL